MNVSAHDDSAGVPFLKKTLPHQCAFRKEGKSIVIRMVSAIYNAVSHSLSRSTMYKEHLEASNKYDNIFLQ